MPKFKEELQFPSLTPRDKPSEGLSLYNENGNLKVLHADGTTDTILMEGQGGDLVIDAYTKAEIDDMLSGIESGGADLSKYYTKEQVEDGFISNTEIQDYALKTEIPVLTDYATKAYVDSGIASVLGDGVADQTLDTIKEISDFLKNDETGVAALTNKVASKQDVLISGANIKTIFGQSVLGSGEIEIPELGTKIVPNPSLTGNEELLTSISIDGVSYELAGKSTDNPSGGNTNVDLDDYYNKEAVDAKIKEVKDDVDAILTNANPDYNSFKEVMDFVNDYIESDETTAATLYGQIANKAEKTDVYTKAEIQANYAPKGDYALKSELLDKNNYYTKEETLGVIDTITGLDNYYDASTIDTKITNINASIELKQDKLTAGENITISEDGVISSSGGGSSEGSAEMIFSDIADETGTPLRTIKVGSDVWSIPEGGSGGESADLSNYYTKDEISNLGYQTEAEVQSAISASINGLVGTAPGTMDTLQELSAALNDDPNVINTLNQAITNKADKSELENYATIEYVDNQAVGGGSEITLSTEAVSDGVPLRTIKVGDINWSISGGGSSSEIPDTISFIKDIENFSGSEIKVSTDTFANNGEVDVNGEPIKPEASLRFITENLEPQIFIRYKKYKESDPDNFPGQYFPEETEVPLVSLSDLAMINWNPIAIPDFNFELSRITYNGEFVQELELNQMPNIVYSETEPENPVEGMIWFSPAQ